MASKASNVANLTATQFGINAVLSYELPSDFPENGRVRVVRSHLGFPQSINDGLVIYEGLAETVTDAAVFQLYGELFYTVFVIDPYGLVSSGAIIRIADSRKSIVPETNNETPAEPSDTTDLDVTENDVSSQIDEVDSIEIIVDGFPRLSDFEITQNNLIFSFLDSPISLSSDYVFELFVPATTLQGDFKTIVATMSDPSDSKKTFSFLLRLNGDQTGYSAMIAPLKVPGLSNLTVEVFDYDTKVISRYETKLLFTAPKVASTTNEVWYWRTQVWLWTLLIVAPLLATALIWFIFWKRDRENEDNTAM